MVFVQSSHSVTVMFFYLLGINQNNLLWVKTFVYKFSTKCNPEALRSPEWEGQPENTMPRATAIISGLHLDSNNINNC